MIGADCSNAGIGGSRSYGDILKAIAAVEAMHDSYCTEAMMDGKGSDGDNCCSRGNGDNDHSSDGVIEAITAMENWR